MRLEQVTLIWIWIFLWGEKFLFIRNTCKIFNIDAYFRRSSAWILSQMEWNLHYSWRQHIHLSEKWGRTLPLLGLRTTSNKIFNDVLMTAVLLNSHYKNCETLILSLVCSRGHLVFMHLVLFHCQTVFHCSWRVYSLQAFGDFSNMN